MITRDDVERVLAVPANPVRVVELAYDDDDRRRWHAGELLDRVPAYERDKCSRRGRRDKYRGQCAHNHYGEVLSMCDLSMQGFEWLYDEYYLYWHRKDRREDTWAERASWIAMGRGVYAEGTRQLALILGFEKLELLWHCGMHCRSEDFWPTEPDLLAWRSSPDGVVVRAIEVKVQTDSIRDDQVLGLEILQRVLGPRCTAEIHRYRRR